MINPQWLELPMSKQISVVPTVLEPLKFDCISNGFRHENLDVPDASLCSKNLPVEHRKVCLSLVL